MRLLLSNDDGIDATGLETLALALQDLAELTIVAPDRNHSGASHSLTLSRPLLPKEVKPGCWAVDGTPTDCVHLALHGLMKVQPDWVISGINHGANLGDDVLYSGTVAAATEGRFLGRPALAISLAGETHWATAAAVVHQLVRTYLTASDALSLPARSLLNINIPDIPLFALKGFRVTRLGHRNPSVPPIATQDPRGQTRYWIAPQGEAAEDGPGTDFHAIAEGYVSVTPLQFDMTRHTHLDQVQQWLNFCN